MTSRDANPAPLVETEWLAEHLGDPELRIYDTTVQLLPDPPRTYRIVSGREDYEKGHIPSAGFLDLAGELSDASGELPFTMPPPSQIEEVLSRAGIGMHDRVVLYSTSNVMWATRLWWMLRACGFDGAAVLDGGFAKWTREGRALSQQPCTYAPATFKAEPRPELWADKDEVLRSVGDACVVTVNSLPREVHTGESAMSYGRKGHIAGSVNVPYLGLMDADSQTCVAVEELRRAFDAVGAFEKERVITYCGGGIAATVDALALTLLGHPNVAVYDGSMSEWVRDESLPMETGD